MSTSRRRWGWLLICLLALYCTGCRSKERSTPGGTVGVLRVKNSYPLPDIQVNVYRQVSGEPEWTATAVTQLDGRFELRTPDGASAYWLEPDEYVITLESVGSVPLTWKEPVHRPEKTPLKKRWTTADVSFDLNVPEPRPMKQ